MTLVKDSKADFIQGAYAIHEGLPQWGFVVGRETGLKSTRNKEKWEFTAKEGFWPSRRNRILAEGRTQRSGITWGRGRWGGT